MEGSGILTALSCRSSCGVESMNARESGFAVKSASIDRTRTNFLLAEQNMRG